VLDVLSVDVLIVSFDPLLIPPVYMQQGIFDKRSEVQKGGLDLKDEGSRL
jgi:hypothetical protein